MIPYSLSPTCACVRHLVLIDSFFYATTKKYKIFLTNGFFYRHLKYLRRVQG